MKQNVKRFSVEYYMYVVRYTIPICIFIAEHVQHVISVYLRNENSQVYTCVICIMKYASKMGPNESHTIDYLISMDTTKEIG